MSAFADQNHAPSLTCVRLEIKRKSKRTDWQRLNRQTRFWLWMTVRSFREEPMRSLLLFRENIKIL